MMVESEQAMAWRISHRADPPSVALADRHYSRQKIGSPQFVPPGRSVVLRSLTNDALWVTSWPYAQYVQRPFPAAWINSLFRNESAERSSSLILQAIAATRWMWPEIPDDGIITLIDATKIRHKRDPGRCYRKAGFTHVGFTKGGLYILQLLPEAMPPPLAPIGSQLALLGIP